MSGLAWRVVAVVLVAAVVGAVPAGPAAAAVERVEAGGTRFTPARVEIELGDSVIWEAADDGHTVTARDGSFDSSYRGMMAEGDEFRWRFRVPGTYGYYCRVHESRGMSGEIVVVDPYAPMTSTTRLTPVTAAATTTTFADAATTTTAPVTTTSRVLSTSSSTSPAVATSTTVPVGTPAAPQEPPTLNPNAPVLNPATGAAGLPEAQASARRSDSSDSGPRLALAVGLLAALGVAGGVSLRRARRS